MCVYVFPLRILKLLASDLIKSENLSSVSGKCTIL